jgi:hypothetical protein
LRSGTSSDALASFSVSISIFAPLFGRNDLCRHPFQPKLKPHALVGKLEGMQAVSVTYSYRLTLLLKVTEREIVLLDIGTHDEVYA